jgi:hypothetical protein
MATVANPHTTSLPKIADPPPDARHAITEPPLDPGAIAADPALWYLQWFTHALTEVQRAKQCIAQHEAVDRDTAVVQARCYAAVCAAEQALVTALVPIRCP